MPILNARSVTTRSRPACSRSLVGLVMVIVVSMVLFILSQGIETAFQARLSYRGLAWPMVLKAVWRISYLTRFTAILTLLISPHSSWAVLCFWSNMRPTAYHKHCIDGYRDPFVAAVNRRGHVWLSGL